MFVSNWTYVRTPVYITCLAVACVEMDVPVLKGMLFPLPSLCSTLSLFKPFIRCLGGLEFLLALSHGRNFAAEERDPRENVKLHA